MEKFYWEPDRSDRVGIVKGIFEEDGLSQTDVEQLVDTFPTQSIDFLGRCDRGFMTKRCVNLFTRLGLTKSRGNW